MCPCPFMLENSTTCFRMCVCVCVCMCVCVYECRWVLLVYLSLTNPHIGLILCNLQCCHLNSEAGDALYTA